MAKRRVVVTGLGIISPVGLNLKQSWDNILAGKSGASSITEFDTSDFSVKFACTVKDFDPELYNLSSKDLRKMDTFIHYGIAAADQALKDSDRKSTRLNSSHRCISYAVFCLKKKKQHANN